MTGLPNMIADEIIRIKEAPIERGVPADSWFEVEFADGSVRTELDTSWAMMSKKETVEYFGSKKIVTVCQFPVKRLKISHEGVEAEIHIPEGCQAYQAIRAEALFLPENKQQLRTVGRSLGYIKDGEVREELYIDALQRNVFGMRK